MTPQETILSKGKKVVPFPVPAWGGEVHYLRPLNAGEFYRYCALSKNSKDDLLLLTDAAAFMVCCALCDKDGARIFTDDDIAKVKSMDRAGFDEILKEAQRISTGGESRETLAKN